VVPSVLTILLHTQSVHNIGDGVGVKVGVTVLVGVIVLVGVTVLVGVGDGFVTGLPVGVGVSVGVKEVVGLGVGVGVGGGHSPVQTPPCTNSPPSYDGVSNAQN
jgi:hypothetical protein